MLDLATRSTLWLGPDDARLAAGSPSTPTTATSPPAAAESEGGEGAPLDETTMTPREVAARAALRRSARLNPSPPPPTAAAAEASLSTSPQQAPGPSPSQIVELEDGSVFFAIPTPGRIAAAAAAAPSTPVPGPSVTADAPHPMPTLTPTSTHGRPLVTLTPLERSATASQPLPSLPLPPTLSNAELARLSAETREAIELRLKLIAHFDGVLGPLRADLARVQQALTRPTVPNPPASAASAGNSFEAFTGPAPVAAAAAAAAASSGDQEPVTRADKGKARAPMDIHLPGGDGDEDDD